MIWNDIFKNKSKYKHLLLEPEWYLLLIEESKWVGCDLTKWSSFPILTKEQEQFIFAKYNLYKYKNKDVKDIKNVIFLCNVRLVRNFINKYFNIKEYDKQNLSSECFKCLVIAIENFNFALNWKFSTYLTTSLYRNMKRYKTTELSKISKLKYSDEFIEFEDKVKEPDLEIINIIKSLAEELPERQKKIIKWNFGIGCKPTTYEQIGKELHITKERVRQIKNDAINSLREKSLSKFPSLST